MPNIKLVFGATVIISSMILLGVMSIAKALRLVLPRILQNNKFEIMLILAVSCVMGIVFLFT